MDGRFAKMVISPLVVLALWVGSCLNVAAADQLDGLTYHNGTVSLALRNVELNNVMEMLSRAGRINILLSGEANTEVSVNLYDVDVEEAIKSVAAAAGMAWEKRGDSYLSWRVRMLESTIQGDRPNCVHSKYSTPIPGRSRRYWKNTSHLTGKLPRCLPGGCWWSGTCLEIGRASCRERV